MTLDPFPHVIWTDLFDRQTLLLARAEFDRVPISLWRRHHNDRERKMGAPITLANPTCLGIDAYLQSSEFISLLEQTFEIPKLSHSSLGGGLHRILPGGKLDVHVDFNRHNDGRYRRLNVLVYLNPNPHPSGDLELCGDPTRDAQGRVWYFRQKVLIPAALGTVVAFVTSDHSWHGHPFPLVGTEERRSIAAYYYTEDPPPGYSRPHSTIFSSP